MRFQRGGSGGERDQVGSQGASRKERQRKIEKRRHKVHHQGLFTGRKTMSSHQTYEG